MKAQAVFSGVGVNRMVELIEAMNKRVGQVADVGVMDSDRVEGLGCNVYGRRQDVMFVIGEVAAQGEDGLDGFFLYEG